MSLVARRDTGSALAERLVIDNDLSGLTAEESLLWYRTKCSFYGLDWRLGPFDYLTLQGKRTLYLNAIGAELLRRILKISIVALRWEVVENLVVATVEGETPDGRKDREVGIVSLLDKYGKRVAGENLANAIAKAVTKAKRRLVLSMGAVGADGDDGDDRLGIPAEKIHATAVSEASEPQAIPVSRPPAVFLKDRLTQEQQHGFFNEAVARGVNGIMPVDPEQEPGTQVWDQVIAAIRAAYLGRNLGTPKIEVLRDQRINLGQVYKALVSLPEVTPEEGEA